MGIIPLLLTWLLEATTLPGVDHLVSAACELAVPLLQLSLAGCLPILVVAVYMHLTVGPFSLEWSDLSNSINSVLREFFVGVLLLTCRATVSCC